MSVDDVEVPKVEENPEAKLIMDNWDIVWKNIVYNIKKWWEYKVKILQLIYQTIESGELTKEKWEKWLNKDLNQEEIEQLMIEVFNYRKIKSEVDDTKDKCDSAISNKTMIESDNH